MKAGKNSIFSVRQDHGTQRMELLDFLRGAAMLLVLLQHSGVPFGNWILAFHMPLLFLLSGYTTFLQERNRRFWDFLKNRFLRLVVPYFLFEGLNLAVWSAEWILQGGWQDVSEAVYAIVACLNTEAYTGYYGRLWFLPCMFVSDLLFYTIRRVCRGRKWALTAAMAGMLALSWGSCRLLPFRLPFAVDTAFLAAFFLLLGYVLGGQIRRLLENGHLGFDILLLAVLLPVLWYSVEFGRAFCLMYVNQYGNFFWTILAAVSGSGIFLVSAKWLYGLMNRFSVDKSLVLWYGYHSLATFPVHLSIKIAMLNGVAETYRPWYVLMLVMLLLNIPVVNFITKYLPFLLGKLPLRKRGAQAANG